MSGERISQRPLNRLLVLQRPGRPPRWPRHRPRAACRRGDASVPWGLAIPQYSCTFPTPARAAPRPRGGSDRGAHASSCDGGLASGVRARRPRAVLRALEDCVAFRIGHQHQSFGVAAIPSRLSRRPFGGSRLRNSARASPLWRHATLMGTNRSARSFPRRASALSRPSLSAVARARSGAARKQALPEGWAIDARYAPHHRCPGRSRGSMPPAREGRLLALTALLCARLRAPRSLRVRIFSPKGRPVAHRPRFPRIDPHALAAAFTSSASRR